MDDNTNFSLVSLKFFDKNLEAEFKQDYLVRSLKLRRYTLVVAIFMYAVFILLDLAIIPEMQASCLWLRFGLVCPAILFALLITYTKYDFKSRNTVNLMVESICSFGTIYLIVHASSPGNHIYYGGLLLCVLFYYILVPDWIISNISSWLTFGTFICVVVFYTDIPRPFLFGNTYIFFFFNLTCMFGCYVIERSERIEFLQRCIIERQNEELQQALAHAEDEKFKAESLARLDPLTDLANRRHFFTLADRELARRDRHPHPLSLLMIDVDHFKQFNDRYGHQAGDLVLKGVAKTIRQAIRRSDTACRYGGEEFAVLLPETEAVAALQLAQRLLASIEGTIVAHGEKLLGVTASLGVATLNHDEKIDTTTLLDRADQALYEAKEFGRNQLRVWSRTPGNKVAGTLIYPPGVVG